MKKGWCIVLLVHCCLLVWAQKPPLTLAAIDTWPDIIGEAISNDGRFVIYTIERNGAPDTLIIQAANQKWIERIPAASNASIVANSQAVVYQKNDSLFIYDVRKHSASLIALHIQSYSMPAAGNGRWLAWLLLSPAKKLQVYDLQERKVTSFTQIDHHQFSGNGAVLLVYSGAAVKWIDLATGAVTVVTESAPDARNFIFDAAARQLVFIVGEAGAASLEYYNKGMEHAITRVNNHTAGIDSGYIIAGNKLRFSPDGKRIIFSLNKKTATPAGKDNNQAGIHIWRYDDDQLLSEQEVEGRYGAKAYTAVITNGADRVVQLNKDADDAFIELAEEGNGSTALVRQYFGSFSGKWNKLLVPAFYAVDLAGGVRKQVISGYDITADISPSGQYIVWFDPAKKHYCSYQTTTGKVTSITTTSDAGWLPAIQPNKLVPLQPWGIAGWLPNEQALLVYDQFDIWKIDPAGGWPPVNITNGYGRLHHVMLRLWNEDNNDYNAPVIDTHEWLLAAFDTNDKRNGFFKKKGFEPGDPVKCSLTADWYYASNRFNLPFLQKYPLLKAKDAPVYMLRRMSSKEYPNVYVSHDLKTFIALSHLAPQKNYNWLTTALINWKQTNGVTANAIVYKPDNFDSTKRYPVLFYFYEQLSHRLNEYLQPEYNSGSINIPWFVSHGYVVCTPDVAYTSGYPGESICYTMESLAHYLSGFSWVDSTRMGVQGHSFGGYEVNYLVSHSKLFAAAQESSGASDFISYYNGFYREHSAQFYFEYGQGRIGHTLWEAPEAYVHNSPIFNADKVNTPLLIMHNREDGEVPFQQGTAWFLALRRLGKKVWLLEYDKEHHGINQPKNKMDFTIRVDAFFAHYLKDGPAPQWLHSLTVPRE